MTGGDDVAVTFDLFGTLVTARRPSDPAAAVARELGDRGVAVPPDWNERYARPHVDVEPGRELPLTEHVRAALDAAGLDVDSEASHSTVVEAVQAAFDRPVDVREGAHSAIDAAEERGPVGVLSNCSVPGLVDRTLERAGVIDRFDAVVASVDVGFRKPDPRAFEAAAGRLGVDARNLVHVGDDPRADGGVTGVGGTAIVLGDASLSSVPDRLREVDHA